MQQVVVLELLIQGDVISRFNQILSISSCPYCSVMSLLSTQISRGEGADLGAGQGVEGAAALGAVISGDSI